MNYQNKKAIKGLGRKIILKFKSIKMEKDEKHDTITAFEPNQCLIQEGQFVGDVLNGFGRSIRGDLKQDKIGFFRSGKLNGYGKMTDS